MSLTRMHIVVVEDNALLADGLATALRDEGHGVDVLSSGTGAADFVTRGTCDLLILDVNLPGCSGLDIVGDLRRRDVSTPVLILTARGDQADKVAGLDAGADDYLAKPFDLDELKARVRALLRRSDRQRVETIEIGSLSFDPGARHVTVGGELLILPARELAVLELLLRRRGEVLPKSRLLDHVFGATTEAADNTIELYVHRLRKRLAGSGVEIRTLRGLGYCLLHVDG